MSKFFEKNAIVDELINMDEESLNEYLWEKECNELCVLKFNDYAEQHDLIARASYVELFNDVAGIDKFLAMDIGYVECWMSYVDKNDFDGIDYDSIIQAINRANSLSTKIYSYPIYTNDYLNKYDFDKKGKKSTTLPSMLSFAKKYMCDNDIDKVA